MEEEIKKKLTKLFDENDYLNCLQISRDYLISKPDFLLAKEFEAASLFKLKKYDE